MGWEKRKGGPSSGYFYRATRRGDQVKKVYYGRGQAGHEAAAELEVRKQDRREARRIIAEERNGTEEADRLAAELLAWADTLLRTWLILTGHHKRRGQWRRTTSA